MGGQPDMRPRPRSDRGVSSVIATVLLVAIVVVLAAGVGAMLLPMTDDLSEPSRLALSVEETRISGSGVETCSGFPANTEAALSVTITQFDRADEVYVIVTAEGATTRKTIWSDPGPDDVGQPMLLANEQIGVAGTDVDIGGSGDVKLCPDEDATFRFYAKSDGQTLSLQTYEFE